MTTTTNPLARFGPCRRDDCPGESPHLHWSSLKYLRDSALHFRHHLEHPKDETAAMRLGRAIHAAALEPLRLGDEFIVYDGTRRGKAWTEFQAANETREILTRPEWAKVEGAVKAIQQRHIQWLTRRGETEMPLEWTEPNFGFPCAGRVDRLVDGVLVEIKSSAIWGERQFATAAARMGYHLQAAWYIDGLRRAGHDVREEAIIVAVESQAPFDVAVYRLPDEAIKAGRDQVHTLLERLQECLEDDRWPGVAEGETILCLPAWAGLDEPETIVIGGEEVRF